MLVQTVQQEVGRLSFLSLRSVVVDHGAAARAQRPKYIKVKKVQGSIPRETSCWAADLLFTHHYLLR